ncbi:hypothetical protein [Clostridium estertheticum]|uniref:hypothetical protein n=1 Tax=Clostridium estertheticum TaxID=238834 RepID=UPI001C6F11AB|nr:hypothetical protein [Clostridium estertheticum]MBW9151460.1 hypothetical protein [Clostridium estertheticum]WLC83403.1 hypothetical protein KTC97_15070 [Clostridium estertheticum]
MMSNIGWNFPLNNYGQFDGINDAGIETFSGRAIEALAKEIIQNSLDAKVTECKEPVIVSFECLKIERNEFPGVEAFKTNLEACKKISIDNDKALGVFNGALSLLQNEQMSILKISDYNTTGLTGSDKEYGGNFNNLTKSVGVSNKDGLAGGSFGIGKHATFSCSKLRTVIYSTNDIDGKYAMQGVSKLVSHKNGNDQMTRGTGYFGVIDKNTPIVSSSSVSDIFKRKEVGTDIIICGFEEEEGWQENIQKSVLENFLVAIMNEKLVVRINGIEINHLNLLDIINTIAVEDPTFIALKYYKALTTKEDKVSKFVFKDNFNMMGEIEFHLLLGKNFPKIVSFVRSTGMKILDKNRYRIALQFVGVVLVNGVEINTFLRLIETPSHDDFQPNRHVNPKEAKKKLDKLYTWIKVCIKSLIQEDDTEQLDAEGISQFLPGDIEESKPTSESGEGEKNKITKIESKEVIRKSRDNNVVISNVNEDENINVDISVRNEGSEKKGRTGGGKNISPVESRRTRLGGWQGGGSSSDTKKTNVTKTEVQKQYAKKLKFKQPRVFCYDQDNGLYRVVLQGLSDGLVYINLKYVFEEGGEPAQVIEAILKNKNESIKVNSQGLIGPLRIEKGVKNFIDIKLKESMRCAMEVELNAS